MKAILVATLMACQPNPLPARTGQVAVAPNQAAQVGSLRAILRASTTADYVVEAMRAERQTLEVELENTGRAPIDLEGLRFGFEAEREGVYFPCSDTPSESPHGREPRRLGPAGRGTFVRMLDCATPLPGRYRVYVYLWLPSWVREEGGNEVGRYTLDVVARGPAPQPYARRPGLFVAVSGTRTAYPTTRERARPDEVVLGLVNGGREPVPLERGRVSFVRVQRSSSTPCGELRGVHFPFELQPGTTHVAHFPLTCTREEGEYVIAVRLALGEDPEVEVGRFVLTVSRDPLLFAPPPFWDGPTQPR